MRIELSCASKTFLLGEYLVLNSGSALVLNLEPRFNLVASTRGSGLVEGIDPNSPAGQWIRQNAIHYRNLDLRFVDPHNGIGGFGASSAQFLFAYMLTEILKSVASGRGNEALASGASKSLTSHVQAETVWRAYRQLESVSQEGLRASGADVAAQFVGGLAEVHTEPFSVEIKKWPFEDCDVVILHTGVKVATHEHLRGLKRVNTEELEWIYARAVEGLAKKEPDDFYHSINDYHAELLEMGLVAEHTQILSAILLSKPFVRAVKGCGALGADTMAVFVGRDNRERLDELVESLQEKYEGLRIVCDLSRLSRGYDIKTSESQAAAEPST